MNFLIRCILVMLLSMPFGQPLCAAPLAVVAPNQPVIEEPAVSESKDKKIRKKSELPADEVDVLISLLEPYENAAMDMDRPSLFAVLYYPDKFDAKSMQPEFRNLLGDVEEIRYMEKKAWGANVDVKAPGLYQFILEAKPWWDEKKNRYLHQQVKTILPVRSDANGWNVPFGQSFEILPLTRPFGLTAPALFSAKVLMDGKPLENIPVRMGRVNTEGARAFTSWHKNLEARTDALGEFSFILTRPGWWYCEAVMAGSPLKGPDGEMRELERSTILWLYVDPMPGEKTGK